MAWQLYLFGSPRLEQADSIIPLKRRKRMALLAYLVVTGQPHSRDALATLLWPEYDGKQAKSNLRRELSTLLRTIGKSALLVSRTEIGINPDFDLVCDVVTFKQLVADTTADSPTSVNQLQQAVALYQADFLAGFNLPDSSEFDDWQFFQREEMRRLAAGAAQILVTWSLRNSAYEEGIGYGRFWLSLDTWHEPAHRELMKLYAHSEQIAGALRQYDECVRLLDEELGVEPEAETTALYEAIRVREFGSEEREARNQKKQDKVSERRGQGRVPLSNLPVPTTAFVGREREVAGVVELLTEPERRLVTVVGPGGMGKTRLALAAATAVVNDFVHGVHFVPLAPLSAVEHIPTTLAEVLHLRVTSDNPQEQVFDYLHDKHLLLVMDNYEHLITGAKLVADLLQAAPQVKVLTTSRERLNLLGEQVMLLGGLAVQNGTTMSGAVQLLQNHAELARPGLQVSEAEHQYVDQICRLVDGMPLALILAASWADVLSFAEIASEIQKNLDFLATDMVDVPQRQRSVMVVFDTSWRRLTADQRQVFMRLSVFHGGFTRQAAEVVAGANLRSLRLLLNHALITVEADGRYSIHELLRQYAAAKLADSTRMEATRRSYSSHYLTALRAWEDDLRGGVRQTAALYEIEADWENIRAAWYMALEIGEESAVEQAVEGLHFFIEISSRYQEGITFLDAAVAQLFPFGHDENKRAWQRLTIRSVFMRLVSQGDDGTLLPLIKSCLQIAEAADDHVEIGLCLWVKGSYISIIANEPKKGLSFLKQSLHHFEALQDGFYVSRLQGMIGYCYSRLTGLTDFAEWLQRAIETARAMDNKVYQPSVLCNLVDIELGRGAYEMAEKHCHEIIAASHDFYDPITKSYGGIFLGLCYFLAGKWEEGEEWITSGAREAELFHFVNNQCYAQAVLSLFAAVSGRNEAAVKHGEASLTNPLHDQFVFVMAYWALAMAYASQGKWEQAAKQAQQMIEATRQYQATAVFTWILPVIAILHAQQDRFESAVHQLALAHHHPLSPTGWLEKWPLLMDIRQQLHEQLGDEAFQVAWEQGKAMVLDNLVLEFKKNIQGVYK